MEALFAKYGRPPQTLESKGAGGELDSEKIWSLSVHPTFPLLAFGTDSSAVKLWNMRSYQYISVLPQVGAVRSVAFSPCGKFLAAAASSKDQELYTISIYMIDEVEGGWKASLYTNDTELPDDVAKGPAKLHQDIITSIAFRPRPTADEPCSVLVSGSHDTTVRFWEFEVGDASEKMKRDIMRVHGGFVTAVAFSDQGRMMATAADSREICVYKFRVNTEMKVHQYLVMSTNQEIPYCLSFFPTHQLLNNILGVKMREYTFLCGTSESLMLVEVKETEVKRETPVSEYPNQVVPDLDGSATVAAERAAAKSRPLFNRRNMSFREKRRFDEGEGDSMESETEKGNFLAVTILQRVYGESGMGRRVGSQQCLGFRSVYAGYHEALLSNQPDDWDGGRETRGCMLAVSGALNADPKTGQVPVLVHTLCPKEESGAADKRYDWKAKVVINCNSTVAAVCFPPKDLRRYFIGTRYIEPNQHYCLSASLDETVRLQKFEVTDLFLEAGKGDAEPGLERLGFVPRILWPDEGGAGANAAVADKYKPIILERPLTDFKAKELFSTNEELKEIEAEKQRLEAAKKKQEQFLGSDPAFKEYGSLTMFYQKALLRSGVTVAAEAIEADADVMAEAAKKKKKAQTTTKVEKKDKAAVANNLTSFELAAKHKHGMGNRRCECAVM